MMNEETMRVWYEVLDKPWFAPEPWVFGVAWGIIYPLIFVAFSFVIYAAVKGRISQTIFLPLVINLIFNLSFTYVQFTLQNNLLAMIWILVVLASLGWIMYYLWPQEKLSFILLIPYALWGTFATILQITITVINW
jgi:tryptophan-rich sensory protein